MKRGFTAMAAAALVLASPALAQVRTIVEPVGPGAGTAEVFFLNESDAPVRFEPPASVTATRSGADTPLVLHAAERHPLVVLPQGFVRLVYGSVPAPEARAPPPAIAAARPGPGDGSAARGILDHLEAHEPMYIIYGAGPDRVKVQFSFAVPLLDTARDDIRFAYTQTMLWAVGEPSWPFTATTYSPRLFYTRSLGNAERPLDLSVGIAHDSTGEAGRGSRDVNRIFARLSTELPLGDDWSLRVAPRAYFYLLTAGLGADDISDYWGYAGLELGVGQVNGLRFSALLRGSFETGNGGAEINASYPLRAIHPRLPNLHLFAQLFTGYGESLLAYREETSRLRFGFAFVR